VQLGDGVYCLHEPEGMFEVEIVFIHGLQLTKDDLTNAYQKAWLVRDGTKDECWPMTWLPKKFLNARILSLSYDASLWRTSTTGMMDLYLVGESLVQSMTSQESGIGQNDHPVVFVCHSLGGLIAKQIVVVGHHQFSNDKRVCKLLGNLKAFFFYATPHQGSKLANLVGHLRFLFKSPLVEYLEVMNPKVGRLDSQFEEIRQNVGKGAWKFYGVGETHATSYVR
jgi:triacylglycerol esterase/lipase EstA (alpha/beta hydrolase family)